MPYKNHKLTQVMQCAQIDGDKATCVVSLTVETSMISSMCLRSDALGGTSSAERKGGLFLSFILSLPFQVKDSYVRQLLAGQLKL